MSPRKKSGKVRPAEAIELRRLRETAGLSLARAAHLIGYNARTLHRWEKGESPVRPAAIQSLRALPANATSQVIGEGQFTFVDLFAGVGGLRLGFESIGGRCLFTSEWNSYSQQTYKANFGDHEVYGDIVEIAAERIPSHDVLLAGFPCQPFSIAGVSKKNALGRPHGFDCDTQGTLFFEVERVLRHHRPKAFLLENVKNLVSHDSGRTFQVIKDTLERKLNYRLFTKVLDAKCLVPQHRERVFLVGFKEEDVGFRWSDVDLPPVASGPRLRSILHPEDGTEASELPFTGADGTVNSKYILTSNLWTYLRDYAAKHQSKGNGFGYGLVGPDDVARTLSARYYKDGSEILVSRGSGNPRRLTPRECARLMGFDRPGRPFRIVVSDTQAYKQFGNAVVVPVVEAIARAMRPFIVGGHAAREQLRLELTA
jgi:DNA (cytosine-5)-methyltransferase 1